MHNTPDASFVPLTPKGLAANERPDFRVTILSQAATRPFAAMSSADAAASPAPHSAHAPRVTLERQGDRVSAIRIQCVCGQHIELACVYEDPNSPQ